MDNNFIRERISVLRTKQGISEREGSAFPDEMLWI